MPVDVRTAVLNIERMCVSTFDRKVRIEVGLAPELPAIDGDPGQLEQALLNLCINARDAMPTGGVLRLSAHVVDVDAARALAMHDIQPGRFVVISVADNGTGMTDDVKSRIFEPFFTTKGPNKGTGLGLVMVYGLAANAGGTVTVESAPNAGSRFDMFLPVSQQSAAPHVPAEVATAPKHAPRSTRPLVLLTDDEPGLREMLRLVLEDRGYDVIEATNGAEAVAAVEREQARLAVVLLDVQMPVMNGVDAFARIRALMPRLPVILGTGFVGDTELAAMRASGADDLLSKPYDMYQLIERLGQLTDATP